VHDLSDEESEFIERLVEEWQIESDEDEEEDEEDEDEDEDEDEYDDK
jgi:hypothetical protein